MSLADEVYRTLEGKIANGEFRPNQRLVEQELARGLGISRTPVREALQRLENQGFVRSERQAWSVREHTPDEISQLFEVRMALEGHAAELAAARASAADLGTLDSCYEQALRSCSLERRGELVQLNDAFHSAVLTAAHNPVLEALARQYHRHYFNYRTARQYTEEEARAAVDGHAAILAALRAGDGPRARAEVIAHLEASRALALRFA